jgi:uncharacterized protein (DUF433 family)
MARYALNLPMQLKQEAEAWASSQGVSLNQFIQWAVSEKVGALKQLLDDPAFPHVTYRRGASGTPTPTIRGTGVRVQSIAIAAHSWGMEPEQIAAEYGLTVDQIQDALDFYTAHRQEIDLNIAAEEQIEAERG